MISCPSNYYYYLLILLRKAKENRGVEVRATIAHSYTVNIPFVAAALQTPMLIVKVQQQSGCTCFNACLDWPWCGLFFKIYNNRWIILSNNFTVSICPIAASREKIRHDQKASLRDWHQHKRRKMEMDERGKFEYERWKVDNWSFMWKNILPLPPTPHHTTPHLTPHLTPTTMWQENSCLSCPGTTVHGSLNSMQKRPPTIHTCTKPRKNMPTQMYILSNALHLTLYIRAHIKVFDISIKDRCMCSSELYLRVLRASCTAEQK